jgi:hypothetical protein
MNRDENVCGENASQTPKKFSARLAFGSFGESKRRESRSRARESPSLIRAGAASIRASCGRREAV